MNNCKFCERLKAKTWPESEWRAEHDGHGGYTKESFLRPGGRWYWLVCKCGHKYLTVGKGERSDDKEDR